MVNETIKPKRDRVRDQVLQYLMNNSPDVGSDDISTSSQLEGIKIPGRLFRGFSRDKIIDVCNEISDSPSNPFLITHEWADELRLRDHTIVAYLVNPSLKTSLEGLVGRHVIGNWSALSSLNLFVAEIVDVNPKPFIDLDPLAEPELYLKVIFYRDDNGGVVEPEQYLGVSCDRYMLGMLLRRLTQEQLDMLKKVLADGTLSTVSTRFN